MNARTRYLIVLLALSGAVSSCSLQRIAKAEPLEPGVKYEVRPAMKMEDSFPAKKVAHYYFMLDVPAHSESAPQLANFSGSNLTVRTTAYCHSESDHIRYGRLAASGGLLRFGRVCSAAADWSRYPLGTQFRISTQPGVVYEVDDYGSALVGSGTIDLYRPTAGSMNAWGVREVDIEIIQWGSFDDSLRLMRNRVQYPHVRQMINDIERRKSQASSSSLNARDRALVMDLPHAEVRAPWRDEVAVPVAPPVPTSSPVEETNSATEAREIDFLSGFHHELIKAEGRDRQA